MPPAVLDRAFFRDLFSQTEADEFLIEHPKTGMLMVLVPAGKFITDTGRGGPFEMELPAFYVAVHPVTNAQYARFVAETGHRRPEESHNDTLVWYTDAFSPEKADHPVVCVSWDDATAYCRWSGLRLPTGLEWEKAARGLDGRAYPWGGRWDSNRCRNEGNKGAETTAGVWRYGQGGAPFGGLQLSGNVWEWCADEVRGGSWRGGDPGRFSAYYRGRSNPGLRLVNYGFRCVRGLATSP